MFAFQQSNPKCTDIYVKSQFWINFYDWLDPSFLGQSLANFITFEQNWQNTKELNWHIMDSQKLEISYIQCVIILSYCQIVSTVLSYSINYNRFSAILLSQSLNINDEPYDLWRR